MDNPYSKTLTMGLTWTASRRPGDLEVSTARCRTRPFRRTMSHPLLKIKETVWFCVSALKSPKVVVMRSSNQLCISCMCVCVCAHKIWFVGRSADFIRRNWVFPLGFNWTRDRVIWVQSDFTYGEKLTEFVSPNRKQSTANYRRSTIFCELNPFLFL